MKVRSIPFLKIDNRGLQECSPEAVGPQSCIMQNRNLERFWEESIIQAAWSIKKDAEATHRGAD